MKKIVYPSILSADLSCLQEELDSIKSADGIHFDVMDGHFVPNLSFGADLIDKLTPYTNLSFDVHLMISCHSSILERFFKPKVSCITIHTENTPLFNTYRTQIKASGIKCGLAINPGTSIESIQDHIPQVDQFLIMTVEPGFGGQAFQEGQLEKIRTLRGFTNNPIFVDGGINQDTAQLCYKAGATGIIAGTTIFKEKSDLRYKIIKQLQEFDA